MQVTPPIDPRHETRQRSVPVMKRRRLLGGIASGVGLLLVALGTVGTLASSTLVWVNRLTDHTFILGTAAAILIGFGLFWLLRPQWLRVVALASCMTVGLAWGALGMYVAPVFKDETLAVLAAPPGPGVDYEVVVREGTDGWIDPAWELTIRQSDGLLAREWPLGCVSGDDPARAYRGVEWLSRDRLKVITGRGPFTITVDTQSGKPQPTEPNPWDGC